MKKIKRFERKWILYKRDPLQLVNSLIRSKLFFKTHFPPRKVNSIYFDTQNFSSIKENLDGISNKKKVRLRWYGKLDKLIDPIIEIKSKKGFETKKESLRMKILDNINFQNFDNLKLIKKYVNLKINPKKTIYPTLTTNYDREYFISSNDKIRATVDYNLKSVYIRNFSQFDIIKNFKHTCILEIKYPLDLDWYVKNNLKEMSLRLSKNSKFVNSAFETPKFFS